MKETGEARRRMWASDGVFVDDVAVDGIQASIDHWDAIDGQRELGKDDILSLYERISEGRWVGEAGGRPAREDEETEPPLATARTHSWPARPQLRGAPTSARRHRAKLGAAEVLGAALVAGSGTLGTEVATAHRSMRGVVIRKAVRPVPIDRIGEYIPNGVIVGADGVADDYDSGEEPPFKIVGGPAPLVLPPPRAQEDPWAAAFADIATLVPPPPSPPPAPPQPQQPPAEDQVAAMTTRVRMMSQAPRPNTRPSQTLSGTLMTTDLANLIPIRLHTVPAMDAASSSARGGGSARSAAASRPSFRGPEEVVSLTARRAEARVRRQRQEQLELQNRSNASLASHRAETLGEDLLGDGTQREGYNVTLKDWKEMREAFKFSSMKSSNSQTPRVAAAASAAAPFYGRGNESPDGGGAVDRIHRGVEEILGHIETREAFTLPEPEVHNTIDMDLDNLEMERRILEAKRSQKDKQKAGRGGKPLAAVAHTASASTIKKARKLLKDRVSSSALGDLEDDIFESVTETAAVVESPPTQQHKDEVGKEQARRAAERELLIENDLRDKDMKRRARSVAPAASTEKVIEQAGLYGTVSAHHDEAAVLSEEELGIVGGMVVSGTDAPLEEIIQAEPFLQFVEFTTLVNQNNALRASLKAKQAGRRDLP